MLILIIVLVLVSAWAEDTTATVGGARAEVQASGYAQCW
jgi:hypothetical protein